MTADRSAGHRLTGVVGELYGLDPDQFTAARAAEARDAKADGDGALAQAIAALPKPSTAAWAVNQLTRHAGDRVDALLDLGVELRAAQAELDAVTLRELAGQRRRLVAAVAGEAVDLAAGLGRALGAGLRQQIESTLTAAMVDEAAERAVRTGCLVRALAVDGLDVDLDGAVAYTGAAPVRRRPPAPPADELAARRAERDAELTAARTEADRLATAATAAASNAAASRALADDAATERDRLVAEVAELTARLDALTAQVHDAEGRRTVARRTADDDERAAAKARRDADAAAEKVARLSRRR